jgi:TRAP-type C4-dicarboxylate transport system substrate-binding protein
VGAAVVQKKSWDRVPADAREAMLKIARETGLQVKSAGRTESDAAVAAMVKRGLKVQPLTPEVDAEWRAIIEKLQDRIRGKIVPADMFDEAQRALKEFRSTGEGKPK